MNVQQFYDHVWTTQDLDEEDLSTTQMNQWLREGFDMITRLVVRFPPYEIRESITTTAGSQELVAPNFKSIRAIEGPWGMLRHITEPEAREIFITLGTPDPPNKPIAWTEYGQGNALLWPVPDQAYTMTVIGYRHPTYDWLDNPGAEPDLPQQFHSALLSYLMWRVYISPVGDDPELGALERDAFQRVMDTLMSDETSDSPAILQLGGTHPRRRARLHSNLDVRKYTWG